MDDLYGDLENYQFENIVSELKNENQELKCKLEEYASTLANLQKDFDKLSGEYKKLELNYSSLLKTARAEIERKSQMITNLNIEKDKLVIDALQQRGRVLNRKYSMGNQQQTGKQLAKGDLAKKENDAAVCDISGTTPHDRKEKHDKTVFSIGPGLTDDPDIKQKSKKKCHNKDKEKTKNAVKINEENPLDVNNHGGVTSADRATILSGPSLKDKVKDNESKFKKLDGCKNREKYKNETKKSKENHSDVSNNGAVTSTDQTTISRNSTFKDKNIPDVKENNSNFKKCDVYKDEEKNKNDIEKSKEKHSDVSNNGAVTSTDQTTMSRNPTFKDKDIPDVKENDSNFKKFDVYKDEQKNKNDIKKSKEKHSDVFSNGGVSSSDQTKTSLDPTLRDNLKVTENDSITKKIYLHKDRENKNEIKKGKDHSDVITNIEVANSVKIRDRRKSMPLLNRGDFQISSDEDQDDVRKDNRFRRRTPVRHDRMHYNKYRDGRNDIERKVPDLIRMGDKHAGNYDSSRDIYRKSYSRYRESDWHKSRDTRDIYEPSQRSRRYYSPDSPYNIQGEYHNRHRESYERPNRFDNVRNRVLVSPPEKYNQHRRTREFEGRGFQNEVVHPMKHKLHNVLEEPVCKRFRSELTNKPPDIHLLAYDRDDEGRANSMPKPLELSYISLQSPDYVYLENHLPVHQIKEIKGTSETKLDDPRLKSKKYIVNTHSNKVVLSTVVGGDKDIKAIDTTKWNTNKDNVHEMPALLRERPQISEVLVKDIYMDIDNPLSNLSLESGEICLEGEETGIVNENKGTVTVNVVQDSNNSVHNNVKSHDQIEINKKEPTFIIDNEEQTCSTVFSKKYRISKIKKSNTSKVLEKDNNKSARNKVKRDSTKQTHKKKKNKDKRDLEKKLQPDSNDCNSLNFFSDTVDVCENKKQKMVDKKHRENSPEKHRISARDTVEGDLELSDETCDYVEDSEQIKCDKGNKVKLGEKNKDIVIDSINKDLNIGGPEKSCTVLENKIESPRENKHFNISHDGHKGQPNETVCTLYKEQKTKDIKSKLCDLFGETSSLITLDDLGIVVPSTTKDNLNEYTPLFENTQDAVDLNVEDMEKVQTRSMKIQSDKDKPIIKVDKKITSESTETADKNFTQRENQKLTDVENNSSVPHMFGNVNAAPEDKTVVKTVIISTGIQNKCNLRGALRDEEQEKQQQLTIQKKTNDNATTISPALLSIKALATSTPYKPHNEPSSVPEISCSSNNSTTTKDTNNISSNAENKSKIAPGNLDIPDVRIIVKRRRKAKGAAP